LVKGLVGEPYHRTAHEVYKYFPPNILAVEHIFSFGNCTQRNETYENHI